MQPLSDVHRYTLSVSAAAHARSFAQSASKGELPRCAEKVVVAIAHKSSPVYAMLRDAGMGAQLDAECWCALLDATEWGLEAFEAGHIGLALAVGDDIRNSVLPFASGMVS